MSFVFYDTETTGTDTWYDQILQFAAIKTDDDLNPVETFEMRCRLAPHIVPAPGAMRVTGVKASMLADPATPCHYDMIRAVQAKFFDWSPAMFIGHNSLEFDEDIFRQALYKTLHPPYLTLTDGNCRSDTLRMLHACGRFAPNAIAIPLNEKNKQTFKLGLIAEANGFENHNAHDALGDVEATVFLSRLVRDKAPDIWSNFMRFSRKPAIVDYITAESVFCWTEIYFGVSYSYLVSVIGQNQENPNEWYVYDLAVAPEELTHLASSDLEKRLAKSVKPVRVLKANGVPILFPADEAPADCKGRDRGLAELERRAELLANDQNLRERLIAAYQARKEEYEKSPHVERQIYDGFFDADNGLMNAFHRAPWADRKAIVDQFNDQRLKTIGYRLIHSEMPEALGDDLRLAHDVELAQRISVEGVDLPWLTIPRALAELEGLIEAALEDERQFLIEHRDFLAERLALVAR